MEGNVIANANKCGREICEEEKTERDRGENERETTVSK
jgi:hypothetical protein